jgi:hypothetical protein
MTPRRFPRPWSAEATDACFIVRDRNGQALAAAHIRRDATFRGQAHCGSGVQRGCGSETLAMFKLPAYDPFAITVMGFGVAIAAILAFAF